MEPWQLALLAVPALVLVVSIIMIVRILRRGTAELRARRVAPREMVATGGAAPVAGMPQFPTGQHVVPARMIIEDDDHRDGEDVNPEANTPKPA